MSDTKSTLLAALPLLFIIGALVAAIIILPQTDLDTRDKAAEPRPAVLKPTSKPELSPNYQLETETVCSGLYAPVCGTDNKTYPNDCEAKQSGVQVAYATQCTTALRQITPTPTSTSSATPQP